MTAALSPSERHLIWTSGLLIWAGYDLAEGSGFCGWVLWLSCCYGCSLTPMGVNCCDVRRSHRSQVTSSATRRSASQPTPTIHSEVPRHPRSGSLASWRVDTWLGYPSVLSWLDHGLGTRARSSP